MDNKRMKPQAMKKWNRITKRPAVEWVSSSQGNAPKYPDPLEWSLNLITIHADNINQGDAIKSMNRHQRIANRDNYGALPAHFYISKEGAMFAGLDLDRIGSHSYLHNLGNVGIVLLGKFHKKNVPLAQFQTLLRLCLNLCTTYEVDPTAVHCYDVFNTKDRRGFLRPRKVPKPPEFSPMLSRAVETLRGQLVKQLTGELPQDSPHIFSKPPDSKGHSLSLRADSSQSLAKVSEDFPLGKWIPVKLNLEVST